MSAVADSQSLEALIEKARAAYRAQDMVSACAAIGDAAAKLPDHPVIAFMHAQYAYEGWYAATELFEKAARLDPGNADLVRNLAFALASEGQVARAERLLLAIVTRHPGWIAGHDALSTLRTTAGQDDPSRSFAEAVSIEPGNTALIQAWFHRAAAAKDWAQARRVVAIGEAKAPGSMKLSQIFIDCEAGEATVDEDVFAPFAESSDPGLALLQVRHALRHGDAARALAIAEVQTEGTNAGQFWPYCSLCWRLLDDPRVEWLEGNPQFAECLDLDISKPAITELAEFLRSLHQMKAEYPEQSVRGGTQTDRNLLLHHSPHIRELRKLIEVAVAEWRDGLPAGETAHPLLSRKPQGICFTGSWSVRLTHGGHHSAHTHPHGWASSALYIVVPELEETGHGGELALGMPPPELGLPLEPTRYVKPKAGRLALFPSTTWHGTIPFAGEERLTIAFDVAPAGQAQGYLN